MTWDDRWGAAHRRLCGPSCWRTGRHPWSRVPLMSGHASVVGSSRLHDPSRAASRPQPCSSGKAPVWPDGVAFLTLTAGVRPALGAIPMRCITTFIVGGHSLRVDRAGMSVVMDPRLVRPWNDLGCLRKSCYHGRKKPVSFCARASNGNLPLAPSPSHRGPLVCGVRCGRSAAVGWTTRFSAARRAVSTRRRGAWWHGSRPFTPTRASAMGVVAWPSHARTRACGWGAGR